MMTKTKSKMRYIYIALVAVSVFFVKPSKAQYAEQQVLYKNLPQARYINPGIFPENTGYFTFPGLSGYGITATNSGFAFKDLFDANGLSPNNLLSTLKNKNYLNVGFVNDIIGFGFRVKKNAFSFNISPKLDVNLGYNKSLFDFLINGNASYLGKDISLDGFGFDASAYLETGIGYSREVNEKLDVGGRIKVLLGAANINGDFDGINLTTNEDDYSLTASSQFSVNAYGTFYVDDDIKDSLGNPPLVNTGNLGLGIDLGGTYKVSDELSVFASIVDLGYLKWADYGETYYNDGSSFSFDGIPYNELMGDDSGDSDYLENLGDTLMEEFKLSRNQISYRTQLKTKLYIGADYKLNKYFDGQGMLFGRFYKGKLYPMYMLAGSFHLKKWLTTKITYAGVNGSYNNIGAGLVLHTGAFQLYVMMDNISGLAAVDYARYMSGSFGINFTFKGKEGKIDKNEKKGKKAKDKKDKAEKSKDKAEDKKEKSKEEQKKAKENKEKASKAKTDAQVKKAKAEEKQAKDVEKSAKSENKKIKVQTQKIKADEKQLNEETKAVKKEIKEIRSSSKSASRKTKSPEKTKNTSRNEVNSNEIKEESRSLIIPSSVETSVNDSIGNPTFNKPLAKDSAVDVNFTPTSISLPKDTIIK